jgi:ElaB/YqjD/DUF883 family membrane-anchored ribosome-binding protein
MKHAHAQTHTTTNDIGHLAEDARALLVATADVAGEKVNEARQRLSAAVVHARELGGRVRDKAVAGAKATDIAVRAHPYHAITVGVGVGALVGYLLARRSSRRD